MTKVVSKNSLSSDFHSLKKEKHIRQCVEFNLVAVDRLDRWECGPIIMVNECVNRLTSWQSAHHLLLIGAHFSVQCLSALKSSDTRSRRLRPTASDLSPQSCDASAARITANWSTIRRNLCPELSAHAVRGVHWLRTPLMDSKIGFSLNILFFQRFITQ